MWWSTRAWAQSFMPVDATEVAGQVDSLYAFLLISSFIACALIIGAMIYFAVKYRRRSDSDKTAYITHNNLLEFLWSFIPFVIFMVVFGWGWYIYHQHRSFPENALEVHAIGKQWSWEFKYKSGRTTANEMVVPVNQPVKVIMTSQDVIHSFYVPSFRIKQDVLPGRYTAIWFEANKVGNFQLFCAEYCGLSHSGMIGKIRVVPRNEYEDWLVTDPNAGKSLAEVGQALLNSKGCVACHSVDGTAKIGPTFKGLWQSERKMADGSTAVADENYIRESLMQPQAKIVDGFKDGAMMPSFQGQLTNDETIAIIEYLKTLE